MKIIIISQYNIFSSIGGTEYYVDMLIKGLVEKGQEIIFITMGKQGEKTITKYIVHQQWQYKCIFLSAPIFTSNEIQQHIVSATWNEILPILTLEKPDVIHVHTYTTFFNIRHFEKCKPICNNLFFTTHIPAHFCPQGDLVKFNITPCDGFLYSRCSLCLFTSGFKVGLGNLVHSYWQKVLSRLRHFNNLDVQLVCVSGWQKQQAIKNGYSADRISVIRQAIATEQYECEKQNVNNQNFTVGYLGRLSPEKGAALLIEVIRKMLLNTNYSFVLGIPLDNGNKQFIAALNKICRSAGGRIQIMHNITANNKEIFFNQIDCLLIPSYFMETGPIVLLEALLFNKQVVAPDVGGPIEFKEDFKDYVTTYRWNDSASLIQSVEKLSHKQMPHSDNRQLLRQKETEFIFLHEKIYSGANC